MYYSAVEKNEIMPFVAKCMDLRVVILSGISQSEREKYDSFTVTFLFKFILLYFIPILSSYAF